MGRPWAPRPPLVPPRPDSPPEPFQERVVSLGRSGWLWLLTCSAVCLGGLFALPNLFDDRSVSTPPVTLLAGSGLVVALVSTVAITAASRARGIPARAAISLGAAFACIALAKFTLGPLGFYEVNQTRSISMQIAMPEAVIVFGSAMVLALYATVLWVLHVVFRARVTTSPRRRALTIGTLLGLVAAGGVALAANFLFSVSSYIEFVFTSTVAGALALVLGVASSLIAHAFASTAERASAIGDASIYSTLFWLALAFVVMFQALWIVYMLTLIGIWPLRTVTPK